MKVTYLGKQQELDTDPKSIQKINFRGSLHRAENTTMFFIFKEPKETVLDFSRRTVTVL